MVKTKNSKKIKIFKYEQPVSKARERERNVLFKDVLNTIYLRLYGVSHMVKDHIDSEGGNPLPLHGLFFPINSKGSFICTIPQTGSLKVIVWFYTRYMYVLYLCK